MRRRGRRGSFFFLFGLFRYLEGRVLFCYAMLVLWRIRWVLIVFLGVLHRVGR